MNLMAYLVQLYYNYKKLEKNLLKMIYYLYQIKNIN